MKRTTTTAVILAVVLCLGLAAAGAADNDPFGFDAYNDAWNRNQGIQDRVWDTWSETNLGLQTMWNPSTGMSTQVPYGYNNYYSPGGFDDTIIGTDSYFTPADATMWVPMFPMWW